MKIHSHTHTYTQTHLHKYRIFSSSHSWNLFIFSFSEQLATNNVGGKIKAPLSIWEKSHLYSQHKDTSVVVSQCAFSWISLSSYVAAICRVYSVLGVFFSFSFFNSGTKAILNGINGKVSDNNSDHIAVTPSFSQSTAHWKEVLKN